MIYVSNLSILSKLFVHLEIYLAENHIRIVCNVEFSVWNAFM